MDVVYLFKQDHGNSSEELRYSLRSLQNIPHGKVVIVGEKPEWARNLLFIPVSQNGTRTENVKTNLASAVRDDRITEGFVLMNDDFFIMKPLPAIPNLNFGPMKQVLSLYDERYPEGSEYIRNMRMLYGLLRSKGYDNPLSYELHVPIVINRRNIQRLHDMLQGGRMYQFRTYYGNHYGIGGRMTDDVKVFLDSRHNNPLYVHDPQRYLESQTFLSATGGSFKKGAVGEFIRKRFPNKSPYEV